VAKEGAASPSADDATAGIPMSEVAKHKGKDSCWVVLFGKVYDLTEFLADHPGGEDVVLKWSGKDATKFWSAIHKEAWIQEYLKPEWCLGPVGPERAATKSIDAEAIKKYETEIQPRLRSSPWRRRGPHPVSRTR